MAEEVFLEQNRRFQIENGDLAIGRVASVGKVVQLRKQKICLSGRLAVLKPQIDSMFLFYSLSAPYVVGQISVGTDLTTLGVLGLNKLKRINILVPPEKEQEAIVKYVGTVVEPIEKAVLRAEREIELMREYRTRLISDMVTGQVDVRGVQVPEIAEEALSALDEDTAESDDVIDDGVEMKTGT
nr:restriction endonuclease subunit S [Nitrosococcus wardiae]